MEYQRTPTDPHTVRDFVEHSARRLEASGLCFGHGTDNAVDEAVELVLAALDCQHVVDESLWKRPVEATVASRIREFLDTRIGTRKPAAYITGRAYFCGLEFAIDERVLVPRSPIAELIETGFSPWLNPAAVHSVLDMCAGSACIGVACAKAFPGARITAVDKSRAALQVAAENRRRHDLGQRLALVCSDLFAALAPVRYDLIVANPPYVSATRFSELPPEYRQEPAMGLLAGDDGLDLVLEILLAAPGFLRENGILVVEVGESQAALQAILPEVPFLWLEFEHGGEGVFLLTASEVRPHVAHLRQIVTGRNNAENTTGV